MNKFLIALVVLITILNVAFAQGGTDLTPADFYQQTKSASEDIQIIDVRTAGEFNSGHIKDAGNIDFNDRRFTQEISTYDKNKPTYIYCLSGGRSAQAMQIMLQEGFTKIYNLKGGIMAWRKAKLPVEGDKSEKSSLSMKEFKKLVNQDIPVLVDFSATWCGPCKVLKPRVARLAKKYEGKLKVIYIDIDKNRSLSNQLNIRAIPLLHLYKKGKLKRVRNEAISYRELEHFIR